MLSPKSQKYRKAHKGRVPSRSKSGNELSHGDCGLKSLGMERVTSRQIESARRAAVRCMKRAGKFFIKIFPDVPVSKKPAEVRMGKGKGSVEFYAVRVAPGRVMFEVDGVDSDTAFTALKLAASKLPIKTTIVIRYD